MCVCVCAIEHTFAFHARACVCVCSCVCVCVCVSMRVSQNINVYINPKSAEMAQRLEAAGNTSKMRTYQTHASSSSVKASKSPDTKSPDSKSSPNERASRPGKFERECVSSFSLTPLSLLMLCLSPFLCTHPLYQPLNILGNLRTFHSIGADAIHWLLAICQSFAQRSR